MNRPKSRLSVKLTLNVLDQADMKRDNRLIDNVHFFYDITRADLGSQLF